MRIELFESAQALAGAIVTAFDVPPSRGYNSKKLGLLRREFPDGTTEVIVLARPGATADAIAIKQFYEAMHPSHRVIVKSERRSLKIVMRELRKQEREQRDRDRPWKARVQEA